MLIYLDLYIPLTIVQLLIINLLIFDNILILIIFIFVNINILTNVNTDKSLISGQLLNDTILAYFKDDISVIEY